MKFSENWLRTLVDVPVDRDSLARALTMAGLDVEEVTPIGASLEGVVVGLILSAEPHPEADRLRICTVDAGLEAPLTIVCGAPNARSGLKAPLAKVGAVLPGGIVIKTAKLRGVASAGMLCSAKELGLDEDASGLMELPPDAPVGQPLTSYLDLPDAVFELSLTPNRADCLSLYGIAFDVAALFGCRVKEPAQTQVTVSGQAGRRIRLEAGADAPRYLGRLVEGIDAAAPTPVWMAERLRRSGLRPISAVVDVTNYVMLELGQPLHAFDNDTLHGDIVVRHARAGEMLTLLDGSEVRLESDFLLIADETRPLAVAGVMGGLDSRVTAATRDVFLEAAHFAPAAIMGRARRLGLHTEASHRFERGVDPVLPERALERATELLLAIAGGRAGPVSRAERPGDLPSPRPIRLRRDRLVRLLGIHLDDAEVVRILTALGMRIEPDTAGWQVTAPSRRFDIEREEDLIEEVARIHGYDRIPVRTPAGALRLAIEPETRISELALREQLAARDYHEAINLAFVSAELLAHWGFRHDLVTLANPLSADLAVMRPSLLPGLVEALRHNRARQQDRVRLFELARVFAQGKSGEPPIETPALALAVFGPAHAEQWGEPKRACDFYDLKGELDALVAWTGEPARWTVDAEALPPWLHPGRSARILHEGVVVGHLGALHPQLLRVLDLGAEVYVLEVAVAPLLAQRLPQARVVPRFPQIRRDIAVELPEAVPWAKVEQTLRERLGPVLVELRLFDRYSGQGIEAGAKSLAMGLILQDASRTLTDEEADRWVREAVSALEAACGAKWRG
ncbi:MAG: phenylalanine--tRNA ligase subunit beta [Fulvimonas sp.]|nr:phenylalanine--tRNA ligase subunit beta [Fulvimonas sp.]